MNWIVIAGLAAAELLLGRWLRGALYTLPALWAWPALDLDWAVTFAMQAAGFIVFASFLEVSVRLSGLNQAGQWHTPAQNDPAMMQPRARCRRLCSLL